MLRTVTVVLFRLLLAVAPSALILLSSASAQIRTDGSVGAARSLLGPNFAIGADLGKQVGGNLFHSFSTFNVGRRQTATFSGPASVANVIGRVTGGQTSQVDGQIASTIPNANLYLLNPSGWVFGAHATLNVQGSVHISSADHLRLADGARFEANTATGSSLTVAPPEAFGFLRASPGAITVNGSTLTTQVGKDLSIIGGPMQATAASLKAPAGQVHIASAAGAGEISLDATSKTKHTVAGYGPVTLSSQTLVDVGSGTSAKSAGSVYIRGGVVTLRDSGIQAPNFGDQSGGPVSIQADTVQIQRSSILTAALGAGDAGSITIDAARGITIDGSGASGITGLSSFVFPDATGNAGNVSVTSGGTIAVLNSGEISSRTYGLGNAGSVVVSGTGNRSAIVIDGGSVSGGTGIFSTAGSQSSGTAGQISISTDTLQLFRTGQISAVSVGEGSPGKVDVTAREITIDNLGRTDDFVGIFSDNYGTAQGGGAVTVHANRLALQNGGSISADTGGPGSAGQVTFIGTGNQSTITINAGTLPTGIFADAEDGSSGPAGQISVSADTIHLRSSGELTASSFGKGPAGSISVTARELFADGTGVTDASTGLFTNSNDPDASGTAGKITVQANLIGLSSRGVISSSSFGNGRAGTITVTGTGDQSTITIDGIHPGTSDILTSNLQETGIVAKSEGSGTVGAAGQISVSADSIRMYHTGQISTSAAGAGSAGNIDVTAREIVADGTGRTDSNTGIFSIAQAEQTTSTGGDITVRANKIQLLSLGTIDSDTLSDGKAGTVTVIGTGAHSTITIDGGETNPGSGFGTGIASNAEAGLGAGGQVSVSADTIKVLRTGSISTITLGQGPAGSVNVHAGEIVVDGMSRTDSGTSIASDTYSSFAAPAPNPRPNAGDVIVRANKITLLRNGTISSSSTGAGQGGNVDIASATQPLDLTASGDSAGVRALALGLESAGGITITAGTISLLNQASVATSARAGGGGQINLGAVQLIRLNNGEITTSVGGGNGNAGDITIDSRSVVLDQGQIRANADAGRGGHIDITANTYIASPDSLLQASAPHGVNGIISIQAPQSNVAGTLAELPANPLAPPALQQRGCSAVAASQGVSSFVIGSAGGLPRTGEGPQVVPYIDLLQVPAQSAARPGNMPILAAMQDSAQACWR